jgi:hypothetical protein
MAFPRPGFHVRNKSKSKSKERTWEFGIWNLEFGREAGREGSKSGKGSIRRAPMSYLL